MKSTKKPKISRELIKALPKTDLHVHLDGSVRIPTLIELAKAQKVKLPSYTVEGMKKLVFKDKYKSLAEYLSGFQYTCAVMHTPEALERIAYELAIDNAEEGVCYLETRFAPQLHVSDKMDMQTVLESVNKGFDRAKKDIAKWKQVKSGDMPPFEYGIIGCAMRKFAKNFSPYYRDFLNVCAYMSQNEAFATASLELARALVDIRDKRGIPVVAFDLAGEEYGYPAEIHKPAYQYALKNFMCRTVHAGEAFGPPSIFQAITDLYADRIGHGLHLFHENLAPGKTLAERKKYVHDLIEYISDRRITVEVCLTSNMQTTPEIKKLKDHPFARMEKERISTTLCTDNRTVSNTTVTNEVALAVENFDISPSRLRNIIIYGFKRSFFPHDYLVKRKYVRHVIDCYDRVVAKFGV
ncbi:MAG: adenosine deaminase [Deltaproteobacteria bacterium CG11_big_fil_rev_8_21_14_0_20_47_16]|nr:MAG: adenosine deaminase [Deltaproteobacteria bacterium CG11_big_fil_rev_8_21_14_0_20_47_16]